MKLCSIDGCSKKAAGRGFCHAHYRRFRKHGDPLGGGIANGERMRFVLEVVVPYSGDDCLQWPYSRNKGYGQIKADGVFMGVHRYVCTICHGDPPSPHSQAAHSCGNGKLGCVNPKHLRWATIKENQLDRLEHGTDIRGEKHPRAKLSLADVISIRSQKAAGAKVVEIARKFGVTAANISQICSGKKWGWLEVGLENQLKSS